MATEVDLTGRVAVVTGALGNLGPVWVSTLADAGATVVGIDVRDDVDGVLGGRAELFQGDVTDKDSLAAVRSALEAGGRQADILVNNAGIDQPPDAGAATRRIEDIPLDEFGRTLEVNLLGTFAATQVFGAAMAAAGSGSIVNIGSLYAGIAPEPAFYDHLASDPPFLKPPAYGASKAGVVQLTRYFARLWGPSGVRVNTLSPGGVLGGQDPEFLAKYGARTPLRRMADPDDLRGPLLFLASDMSRYMTGHELRVDGGFTA
jgi:NAD(P)-dependent dehydrogenase (short-subunit alcohol dehydrogenase family)